MKLTHLIPAFLVLAFLMAGHPLKAQCTNPVNSFPYTENFETSNGGWVPGGTASDWSWGTPIKPVISSAASGSKCWITGTLTQSSYSNNQNSTLTSPCFDFTGLSQPYIKFSIFWETEKKYDGASFQYSIDGGNSWTTLGSYADFVNCPSDNWYNTSGITSLGSDGWSGNIQPTSSCTGGAGGGSGQWKVAQNDMPMLAGQPNVRFRFRFAAGNVCNNYDGFAVDNIWIGQGPNLTPDFTYTCTGSNTVSFTPVGTTCNMSYYWDFGDPASGTGNTSTLTTPSHTFSGPGLYTITVMNQLAPNPTPITRQVTILEINTAVLTPISCFGDEGTLQAQVNPAGSYVYQWNTNPVQTAPTATISNGGNYTITVSGSNTCTATDNITIPSPAPVITYLGQDTVICSGEQVVLDAGNFSSYYWQNGATTRTFTVTQSGLYHVQVEDAGGCTASDSIRVTVDCSDIYFPSAFTPNGDGKNERFGALGNVAAVKDFALRIYNRWGQLVFQTKDANAYWNGTVEGRKAGMQGFAWFAEYTIQATGSRKMQKGTVTLIR